MTMNDRGSAPSSRVRDVPFFGDFYRRTTGAFLSASVTAAEASFIGGILGLGPLRRGLDLGCGDGRHLAKLSSSGAALAGVDIDRPSLAAAARFACAVQGDLRWLPFAAATFDAAYCWYSTLFVFDEEGNRCALSEAARVLVPGGRFLMQSVNPERLARAPESCFEAVLPDGSRLEERARYDPSAGRDEGSRTLLTPAGEALCGRYSIRYYSLPEIETLCRLAGLRVAEVFGGVGGEAFLEKESLDLIVLATKEGNHGD
jgi:SAM-dependent methyltransferase